ncbi:nad-dependent histone deacetylase, partial [Trichoderma cornu-damae]
VGTLFPSSVARSRPEPFPASPASPLSSLPPSLPPFTFPMAPHNDVEAFHHVLRLSRRILALCGAGLSASSGLPTFRGAGGLWRNYDATQLATVRAFKMDPGMVWLFYAYRRHLGLKAKPNAAHKALAALARQNPDFLCLTQNVDSSCDWIQRENFDDPFCAALAPASVDMPNGEPLPLLDPYHRVKHITEDELPKCPQCQTGLQRPGVVWFGEDLDATTMMDIGAWMRAEPLHLMFVIGTSAQVYPAAGYIEKARKLGASIVTINPEAEDEEEMFKVKPGDFAFGRDAAECLPILLEPIIGKPNEHGEYEIA